ncbi:flavin reductase family protein [Salipiger mangrovisoli]|uniref:Flavin reductase n=1 Tax=Salipiger mangrovisoli TaxID=2865933 RepID=A0ABR9XB76_9RHOB|nr:flavin reductase family protein [Salipiger mangrovisoli]MBE9640741.1 flavin reductase [Salipiger mangrovisoli]
MKPWARQYNMGAPLGVAALADPQQFRDAMATLAATVCVVTSAQGKDRLGRTVTAAISLGVVPPAILVSIAAGSELDELIRQTGRFSYAMLSEGQDDIADAFAGQVPPEGRFFEGDWATWSSGSPRLLDCVAAMDCRVAQEFEAEGHVLFVGHVQEIARSERRKPLLWYGRRYGTVSPQ